MPSCNCQMMTKGELNALFQSEDAAGREQAICYIVGLLTSADMAERRQGYELFGEGVADALFRSCLNYGSLAGGFIDPLVAIVMRAVETWAASPEGIEPRSSAELP